MKTNSQEKHYKLTHFNFHHCPIFLTLSSLFALSFSAHFSFASVNMERKKCLATIFFHIALILLFIVHVSCRTMVSMVVVIVVVVVVAVAVATAAFDIAAFGSGPT